MFLVLLIHEFYIYNHFIFNNKILFLNSFLKLIQLQVLTTIKA